ncbi:hypothetical protein U1Q18_012085 [Sarracenia purpurea var. burkii]
MSCCVSHAAGEASPSTSSRSLEQGDFVIPRKLGTSRSHRRWVSVDRNEGIFVVKKKGISIDGKLISVIVMHYQEVSKLPF